MPLSTAPDGSPQTCPSVWAHTTEPEPAPRRRGSPPGSGQSGWVVSRPTSGGAGDVAAGLGNGVVDPGAAPEVEREPDRAVVVDLGEELRLQGDRVRRVVRREREIELLERGPVLWAGVAAAVGVDGL